jgi:hypothetical protein
VAIDDNDDVLFLRQNRTSSAKLAGIPTLGTAALTEQRVIVIKITPVRHEALSTIIVTKGEE